MTDLLLATILVGAATTSLIELLDMLLDVFVWNVSKAALKKWLTLPSCVGGSFLLGVRLPEIVVIALAALLVSLIITMWLDKPVMVQKPVRRSLEGLL
jgi:hypothetical protein